MSNFEFYLFYSINCPYSNKLIDIIKNEQLTNICKFISIEDNDNIPDYVESVPTIIAKNLSKPLIGVDALEWVKNKKYFYQITNNITKKNIVNPNIKNDIDKLGFNKKETLSISDNYTMIKDDNNDIQKSMLKYEDINKDKIITNDIINNKIDKNIHLIIQQRKNQLLSKKN
jgi:hypothetical protein